MFELFRAATTPRAGHAADENLNREEIRARLAALDKSLATIEFALDGTILRANANFLAVMGYELAEIAGQKHTMFVDPSEIDSAPYQEFWAALRRGQFQSAEYRRVAKGGREVWIQATYNPVLDRLGRPV